MKFLLLSLAVLLPIAAYFLSRNVRILFRIFVVVTVLFIFAAAALTILPPIVETSPASLAYRFKNQNFERATFLVSKNIQNLEYKSEDLVVNRDGYGIIVSGIPESEYMVIAQSGAAVIEIGAGENADQFRYLSISFINPIIYYPRIPALGEYLRLFNLHVPLAWAAVLGYLLSMVYSIRYLKSRDITCDKKAAMSASLGLWFTIGATVSGMFWAKINWGSYWNWDPRETSIFALLLIYFAYFALRKAIDSNEQKGKLAAVYSILAFVIMPFLVFVLPRVSSGLHPGSLEDSGAGPVISSGGGMLDSALLYSFAISMTSVNMLFFMIFNSLVRRNDDK